MLAAVSRPVLRVAKSDLALWRRDFQGLDRVKLEGVMKQVAGLDFDPVLCAHLFINPGFQERPRLLLQCASLTL